MWRLSVERNAQKEILITDFRSAWKITLETLKPIRMLLKTREFIRDRTSVPCVVQTACVPMYDVSGLWENSAPIQNLTTIRVLVIFTKNVWQGLQNHEVGITLQLGYILMICAEKQSIYRRQFREMGIILPFLFYETSPIMVLHADVAPGRIGCSTNANNSSPNA